MKLQVDENITLNRIYKKDKRDLVSRISHPEIAKNTLTIPYPYKSEDADFFFNLIEQAEKEKGKQLNWAIRHKEDGMIGSIGLLGGVALGNPSRDAFGYWLWEQYWNKGVMTKVVEKFTEFCLNEGGLNRLEATVFYYNQSSARVLEKSGFEKEGYLKKAYLKNGEFIDGVLFAKVK